MGVLTSHKVVMNCFLSTEIRNDVQAGDVMRNLDMNLSDHWLELLTHDIVYNTDLSHSIHDAIMDRIQMWPYRILPN